MPYMIAKEILFGHGAHRDIATGLDASWGVLTSTRDEVTVAKEIEFEDRYTTMGVPRW